MRTVRLRTPFWTPKPGSGWQLIWQLVRLNYIILTVELLLAAVSAMLFYTPAYFLQHFVLYLELEPGRENKQWGWVYVLGLFGTNAIVFLSKVCPVFTKSISSQSVATGQLWSLATTKVQVRLRIQLNSILFAKTLVRKDVASSSPPSSVKNMDSGVESTIGSESKSDEEDFSSKAQVMTLMTTDVDRVSDFSWHIFSLVGMLH